MKKYSPKQFQKLLQELGACEAARVWAEGKTLHEVWETCERGDWLLWLCARMKGKKGWPTHQDIVLAACACAKTSLKFVPKGEDRPKQAIKMAEAWCRGEATVEQVRDAAYAAADAAAYAAADDAADDAAYAAAYAAADDAAYAAAAAAYAADAVTYSGYTVADARKKALKRMANLVRKWCKLEE